MSIEREQLPMHYLTQAGEIIELTKTDFGGYCVDCWDQDENNRWSKAFDKFSDALSEYEHWRYLELKPAISQAKD